MEGVDFAGKTGTAQVVGGGDTHTKGGAKHAERPGLWAWCRGATLKSSVVVLQEHGDWGAGSAQDRPGDRD